MNTLARRFAASSSASASALTKRKRFYKEVSVLTESVNGNQHYQVALDHRILKTQGGQVLKLESEPLALAIAEEWASQEEFLQIGQMRLTGLAFTAQDNPLEQTTDSVTEKVVDYLHGDTVLFWNTESSKLHRNQIEKWGPLIKNINDDLNVSLRASESIMDADVCKPEDSEKIARWIRQHNLPSLIGIQYATESIKSFVIAYNTINMHIDAETAVDAGTLEQRIQAETWGSVEWAHGIEREELLSRLSAAALFVYFNSNKLTKQEIKATA